MPSAFRYGDLGLGASHRAIAEAVPCGARVLDVGCASGHLGALLRDRRRCTVVGIERDAQAAAEARERGIEVRVADVDDQLAVEGFDVVVFGDVLEHLRDPATVLRRAHAAPLTVVSLPNIAHWTARRALLRGRFPQADHGLFDRTHLHHFTRASAHALARDAGFDVVEERFTEPPLPLEAHLPQLRALRAPLVRRAPELLALQLILSLQPRSVAR